MQLPYEFDEATHIYRVARRVVPGVTRVLDHTGLVDYSRVRQDIRENSLDRGKRVHVARHYYDENDLDINTVREEERGYIESWIACRRITGYTPVLTEFQTVFDFEGHPCGMKLDSAGYFPKSNRLAIIDAKTGDVEWWVGVQTAGYTIGLPSHPTEKVTLVSPLARFLLRDRFAARLFADGRPAKLEPFTDRSDYYDFAAALYLTHRKLERGIRLREDQEPCQQNN